MADASRSRATAYTTFSAHKPGHALDHRWRDGHQCDNNEPGAYAEKSGTRRDRRDGAVGNVSSASGETLLETQAYVETPHLSNLEYMRKDPLPGSIKM